MLSVEALESEIATLRERCSVNQVCTDPNEFKRLTCRKSTNEIDPASTIVRASSYFWVIVISVCLWVSSGC